MMAQSSSSTAMLKISAARARSREVKDILPMASMIGRASKVLISICSTVFERRAALSLLPLFFTILLLSRSSAGRLRDLGGLLNRHHGFRIKSVELGLHGIAIRAKVAENNPVAFTDIIRQRKTFFHLVHAVASRPVELEERVFRRNMQPPGPVKLDRIAPAELPEIEQRTIVTIVEIKRLPAAKLNPHRNGPARRHKGPAGFAKYLQVAKTAVLQGLFDGIEIVLQRRRIHVRIGNRKAATDINHVDFDAAPVQHIGDIIDGIGISLNLQTL